MQVHAGMAAMTTGMSKSTDGFNSLSTKSAQLKLKLVKAACTMLDSRHLPGSLPALLDLSVTRRVGYVS